MKPLDPQPVQYFIAALYSDRDILNEAVTRCESKFGKIEARSQDFLFDTTEYYHSEMGRPIYRTFLTIERPMNPGKLAHFKITCNQIEDDLSILGKRKVNLDIGYIDFHKLVLASAKYNGQKVYLDQGIYADITLIYERGAFQALPNTFPDFQSTKYFDVFNEMRISYKAKIKSM